MTNPCLHSGYQSSFWKKFFYCRDCGADLHPGKALMKPWKCLLFLIATIFLVSAILLFLFAFQWFKQTYQPELRLDPVALHYRLNVFFWSFFSSQVLFYTSLFISLPFGCAAARLHQYRSLLQPHSPRQQRRAIALIVILLVFALALDWFLEPLTALLGITPIDIFSSPWLWLPLASLILFYAFRQIKASYKPLYPLQRDTVTDRFVEVKPGSHLPSSS